jgi:nitroreductase
METWDAIRARRNVRQYTDRPISDDDLNRILEAGWRAPSGANNQSRMFIAVTDRDQLVELSTVWQGAGHVANSAATIALIAPEGDPDWIARYAYDSGQATMQMAIAATDLGIGSGHAGVGDQDAARRILGLPEDHRCLYMLALGYPADRPLAPILKPDRKPWDEIVRRGHW